MIDTALKKRADGIISSPSSEETTSPQVLIGLIMGSLNTQTLGTSALSSREVTHTQAAVEFEKGLNAWCQEARDNTNEDLYQRRISAAEQIRVCCANKSQTSLTLDNLSLGTLPKCLGALTHLKTLSLKLNNIADISALSTLVNLESLYLDGNRIEDIHPLRPLVQLTKLDLSNNQIRDPSALASLAQLEELYLNKNKIHDTSSLAPLISHLRTLKLEENLMVENDPLNSEQKEAIATYVDGILLRQNIADYCSSLSNNMPFFKALSKISDADIDPLNKAKELLGDQTFEEFREALSNPKSQAARFKINPADRNQIFAARTFMKAAIRESGSRHTIDYLHEAYQAKMCRQKNQMLMKGPLQELDSAKTKHSALEIILANTYIQTPSGIRHGDAKEIYIEALTDLSSSPVTAFIFAALAHLIREEKGNIFFGGDENNIREMRIDTTAQTLGQYNTHHSIFSHSLLFSRYNFNHTALGTFIHEAQHFLFNRIVKNKSSPVGENDTQEQAELDTALQEDRDIRGSQLIWPGDLGEIAKTFDDNLESNPAYFGDLLFDPANAGHLHTMRVEAIVRIMELLARGYSETDIRELAPNLYEFYYKYSKPRLEKYALPITEEELEWVEPYE